VNAPGGEQTKDGLPPLGLAQRFEEAPGGAVDFRGELLRLNKGLIAAFLGLLNALVAETAPAWEEQLDEVRAFLHNMMFLANHLRPIQARAALRAHLEQEAAARRVALHEVGQASELARTRIAEAEAQLRATPGGEALLDTARGPAGGGEPPGAGAMEVG